MVESLSSFADRWEEIPLPIIAYSSSSLELEEEEVTTLAAEELPNISEDLSQTSVVIEVLGNLEQEEEVVVSPEADKEEEEASNNILIEDVAQNEDQDEYKQSKDQPEGSKEEGAEKQHKKNKKCKSSALHQ